MRTVLDASAVIAAFRDEPATIDLAGAIEDGSFMSASNLAEVAGWLARSGDADQIRHIAETANVAVVPLLEELALRAGELEPMGRPFGLSLADRCCLATAEAFDAQVLTTDRAWLELPSPWRERVVYVRADAE